MGTSYHVSLKKLIEEFDLEVLHGAKNLEQTEVEEDSINRPGLQLVGFYEDFAYERIQIVGRMEKRYLEKLNKREREKSFAQLFSYEIPALILSRGETPFEECLDMARKYDRTVLRSQEVTGELISNLTTALKTYLSPRITRHGVLLEVHGEGVLLLGESGVGKSEVAVELIKRGHRLIADDAVEIRRTIAKKLTGTAPELIRHYIELRGVGIIDVRRIFGMSAVKESQEIDLIVNLETWKEGMVYDRLGLENFYTSILDVRVPTLTIPVKPGRNLAVIIEVAAMNNRHKKMGFNAAQEFAQQINAQFDQPMSAGRL